MKQLSVNIKNPEKSSYQILIGSSLLKNISKYVDFSKYSKIAIITDTNVLPHLDNLKTGIKRDSLVVALEPGEKNKNIKTVEKIWKSLTDSGFDRKSLIINLGGGVVTDMGGFAAGCFMRGIDFINIPTTLLSQVDASIGGKTGINFENIKNLIGTFSQPFMTLIDTETLHTLPKREFISGFAEIIKHGLIKDKDFFNYLGSKQPYSFSPEEIVNIIEKSCLIKKEIFEKDPVENGPRKILNFGHTIGHAIESLSHDTQNPLLHGEAIAIGIMAEGKMSEIFGLINDKEMALIKRTLENAYLPIKTDLDVSLILKKIKNDKKNNFGQIKWTLLKEIGNASYDFDAKEEIVKKALSSVL
jgi:3-dehydroquinate synthase